MIYQVLNSSCIPKLLISEVCHGGIRRDEEGGHHWHREKFEGAANTRRQTEEFLDEAGRWSMLCHHVAPEVPHFRQPCRKGGSAHLWYPVLAWDYRKKNQEVDSPPDPMVSPMRWGTVVLPARVHLFSRPLQCFHLKNHSACPVCSCTGVYPLVFHINCFCFFIMVVVSHMMPGDHYMHVVSAMLQAC